MSKFDVIVCDAPHEYVDKALAGARGAGCKYSTLNLDELNALPVNDVASEDALLFFWGTWPLLGQHIGTINRWGFEYKTLGFIWIKLNKVALTPFWGMGNWTRSNSEFCLLATKGNVKSTEWRQSASVHSVINAPIMSHSKKPIQVMEMIEQLVGPDKSKLELFATSTREGWTSLGFSVNNNRDIRDTLPELINRTES